MNIRRKTRNGIYSPFSVPKAEFGTETLRLGLLLLALSLVCVPAARAGSLLVGYLDDSSIKKFDGTTGAYLGNFVAPGAGGLSQESFFIFGPDGNLYVSSINTGSVKRYAGTTGAYLGDFVLPGSGLTVPYALAFGPNQNLYVANGAATPGVAGIFEFNGTTGALIDQLSPVTGAANYIQGLTFGADGNVYATNIQGPDQGIVRFNGATGAFMDVFAPISTGDPTSIAFGPDGNLYVTLLYGHKIERYNGITGADMGTFVPTGSGGLFWDGALSFGPDGNLYVTEWYSGSVGKYDGSTGAFLGDLVSPGSGGSGAVFGLQFDTSAPEPSGAALLLGGLSLLAYRLKFGMRRMSRKRAIQACAALSAP